jgi:hypothetical protein
METKLKSAFSIAALTLCSGCLATTEGYKSLVGSWVDAPETELVDRWGVPDAVYTSGKAKFLKYGSQRNVYIPGTSPTYTSTVIGNTVFTNSYGGTSAQNITMTCITTFRIENSRVVGGTFEGNDCKAKLPPPA